MLGHIGLLPFLRGNNSASPSPPDAARHSAIIDFKPRFNGRFRRRASRFVVSRYRGATIGDVADSQEVCVNGIPLAKKKGVYRGLKPALSIEQAEILIIEGMLLAAKRKRL
jgi:hypothetical protein